VHRCVGIDGRCSPKRIAAVVSQLGADVVALQEVDARLEHDQLAEIARAGGYAFVRGPTLRHRDGHYGNGVLTRLPVRNARLLDLSVERREPRGAIDVVIDGGAAQIRVLATHLGLSPDERRIQCEWLGRRVTEPLACDVTLLLGDFNEWWTPSRLARLARGFGRSRAVRTFPSPAPLLALDRIWVRPARALLACRAHRSALARIASDHLPLRAIVDLAVCTDGVQEADAARPEASPA
jgi:endonuclease/exonuclease/phosphatase family metal-dependent hydrolase